ncbi:ABC transporter ATP-binding protein [Hymenobacter tenuis]
MKNSLFKGNIVNEALINVLSYLDRKEKIKAIWMFFLLIIGSLLDVFGLASLVPIIMAASEPGSVFKNKYALYIYENFGFSSEKIFLLSIIVSILLFFILKNVFVTLINYQQVKFTAKIGVRVVQHQYDKYLNIPYYDFLEVGTSTLTHNILALPMTLVSQVIRNLFTYFSEVLIISVICIGIFVYQPMLMFILLAVLAPTTILTYRFLKNRSSVIGSQLDKLRPVSYGLMMDVFSGFVELKLSKKHKYFKDKLLSKQIEIQNLEARSYLFSLLPLKVIEMAAIMAVVTIFIYSLLFSNSSALVLTIGLFAASAYRLMPSVNRLLLAVMSIKQQGYIFDALSEYEEYSNPINHQQKKISFTQNIIFNKISFSYPKSNKVVIDDIDITINKGDTIGFIGASGSGKTTLMNILLRFYVEGKGNIFVDGQPLSDENIDSWYDIVGYVKQDAFLMQASIKNNITLYDENIDNDRLDYAIRQASLTDFIASLPNGIETEIGERGSKLSGGQRQRIGIARALYKRTEIMIMDEATSALDNQTEREVSEAINKLSETNITILIVAHRITTLRDCNRIYELKDGKIYAEYQYEDLLKKTLS